MSNVLIVRYGSKAAVAES